MDLDKNFWDHRYHTGDTGWDAGNITTPLKEYFDQLKDKKIKILIPGAGYGHEAKYLWERGFTNLFVADISSLPLESIKESLPNFPDEQLLNEDFFELAENNFDLIVEQTFFCAIHPKLRKKYAEKMHSLLRKGGKLAGLLFDDLLNDDKPPFGGTKEEYISYFRPLFEIKYFDKCYNSISPRAGRELFILLIKL
jgi:thiopurine S-methyltransferase